MNQKKYKLNIDKSKLSLNEDIASVAYNSAKETSNQLSKTASASGSILKRIAFISFEPLMILYKKFIKGETTAQILYDINNFDNKLKKDAQNKLDQIKSMTDVDKLSFLAASGFFISSKFTESNAKNDLIENLNVKGRKVFNKFAKKYGFDPIDEINVSSKVNYKKKFYLILCSILINLDHDEFIETYNQIKNVKESEDITKLSKKIISGILKHRNEINLNKIKNKKHKEFLQKIKSSSDKIEIDELFAGFFKDNYQELKNMNEFLIKNKEIIKESLIYSNEKYKLLINKKIKLIKEENQTEESDEILGDDLSSFIDNNSKSIMATIFGQKFYQEKSIELLKTFVNEVYINKVLYYNLVYYTFDNNIKFIEDKKNEFKNKIDFIDPVTIKSETNKKIAKKFVSELEKQVKYFEAIKQKSEEEENQEELEKEIKEIKQKLEKENEELNKNLNTLYSITKIFSDIELETFDKLCENISNENKENIKFKLSNKEIKIDKIKKITMQNIFDQD